MADVLRGLRPVRPGEPGPDPGAMGNGAVLGAVGCNAAAAHWRLRRPTPALHAVPQALALELRPRPRTRCGCARGRAARIERPALKGCNQLAGLALIPAGARTRREGPLAAGSLVLRAAPKASSRPSQATVGKVRLLPCGELRWRAARPRHLEDGSGRRPAATPPAPTPAAHATSRLPWLTRTKVADARHSTRTNSERNAGGTARSGPLVSRSPLG